MAKDKSAPPVGEGENVNGRMNNQAETPPAQQSTDQFGDQVRPETQTDEDNGGRTLTRPVTDPGPVMRGPDNTGIPATFKHPERGSEDMTYSANNDPIPVLRRTTTVPEHFANGDNVSVDHMAPDLAIHSGASDVYNKEQGEGLSDIAMERANRERELTPLSE